MVRVFALVKYLHSLNRYGCTLWPVFAHQQVRERLLSIFSEYYFLMIQFYRLIHLFLFRSLAVYSIMIIILSNLKTHLRPEEDTIFIGKVTISVGTS